MVLLITVAAAVALGRGVWVLARLMRAVPRANADFALPEAGAPRATREIRVVLHRPDEVAA